MRALARGDRFRNQVCTHRISAIKKATTWQAAPTVMLTTVHFSPVSVVAVWGPQPWQTFSGVLVLSTCITS
jgi:hypothetical protein